MRKTFAAFLLTALSFDGAPNRPADTIRFGPNGAFRLEYTSTSFGREASGVIEVVKGRVKKYPLPQSSFATYARLRPGELKNMQISAKDYERLEWIGPHQVEGSRLWFGKQFYDGEGMTGVGAFGYFDTDTRRYHLFSPPEVAPYETSAILVEPDSVWLGLDSFVEDISAVPGGLIRWSRTTHEIRHYKLEFVISGIERRGNSLYLKTRGGYAILRNDILQRFALRKGSDGKFRSVAIRKFPPQPSLY
ncbi:MAG TPA: hypothetical protein VFB14_27415 [Bryobacteraceae bacterium]|nr:hypothetical protein [Bryobacteraceae bacterium]